MRDALVAAGVPTNAITCDYAGFRTLDSVVRAKTVFGLTNFTIVTEEFHCPRSVWIARRHGLERGGFRRAGLERPVVRARKDARSLGAHLVRSGSLRLEPPAEVFRPTGEVDIGSPEMTVPPLRLRLEGQRLSASSSTPRDFPGEHPSRI
jgi:hypothetical protein